VPPHGRAWLVCKLGRWYAQFECERAVEPLPETAHAIGLDRGVNVLLATSDGDFIANPRHVGKARLQVERAQRVVAKRKRRGKNRRKAIDLLARIHEKVARQRRDYAHKVSRALVDANDVIVLEDLRLRTMTRSAKGSIEEPGRNVAAKAGLNRALLDAGFGMIAQLIAEKAESAARSVIYVDPKYTSQTCAACGHIAKENRSGLQFACVACSHVDHADVNAARVILQRAQKRALGEPRRSGGRHRPKNRAIVEWTSAHAARCSVRAQTSKLPQIGIGVPLCPDVRKVAVSRNDRRRVGIVHQLGVNRRDDVFHRRSTQIPAPDRSREQRVAG